MVTKTDDPDKWFMEIDKLNNCLYAIGSQYAKANYELKAHYLGNLPKGYKDVFMKLISKLNKHDILDFDYKICSKWKQTYKPKIDKQDKRESCIKY